MSENDVSANDVSENEPAVEQPEQPQTPEPVEYELRRAPKYLPFGVTGAVIGIIAGLVLAFANPVAGDYSERAIVGYFAVILGLVGALLGLGTAVLIERRR